MSNKMKNSVVEIIINNFSLKFLYKNKKVKKIQSINQLLSDACIPPMTECFNSFH